MGNLGHQVPSKRLREGRDQTPLSLPQVPWALGQGEQKYLLEPRPRRRQHPSLKTLGRAWKLPMASVVYLKEAILRRISQLTSGRTR